MSLFKVFYSGYSFKDNRLKACDDNNFLEVQDLITDTLSKKFNIAASSSNAHLLFEESRVHETSKHTLPLCIFSLRLKGSISVNALKNLNYSYGGMSISFKDTKDFKDKTYQPTHIATFDMPKVPENLCSKYFPDIDYPKEGKTSSNQRILAWLLITLLGEKIGLPLTTLTWFDNVSNQLIYGITIRDGKVELGLLIDGNPKKSLGIIVLEGQEVIYKLRPFTRSDKSRDRTDKPRDRPDRPRDRPKEKEILDKSYLFQQQSSNSYVELLQNKLKSKDEELKKLRRIEKPHRTPASYVELLQKELESKDEEIKKLKKIEKPHRMPASYVELLQKELESKDEELKKLKRIEKPHRIELESKVEESDDLIDLNGFDFESNEKSGFDFQSNEKLGFDFQSNEKLGFDFEPSEKLGFDFQPNEKSGFDFQPNEKSGFDFQSNEKSDSFKFESPDKVNKTHIDFILRKELRYKNQEIAELKKKGVFWETLSKILFGILIMVLLIAYIIDKFMLCMWI